MPEMKTTEEIYDYVEDNIARTYDSKQCVQWNQQWMRKEDYDALIIEANRNYHNMKALADKLSSLRAEIEKINPVTQDTWAAGVLHCKNRILSLLDKEASK